MDSKLEEADTDFQGIADPGCKGLSNSSVESLNLYSCGSMSSTCDFKPLVETSSSDLLDYLDLHDSSQAESYQLGHGLTVDGESTAGCFETDSFVCIDVALETWEKAGKDTKTVPKRQIQLKRHNSKEPRVEGEGNIDAGNMSERKHMKDVCLRQHSFPAAVQEASCKTELQSVSGDRKQKLQKSLSLDETSSRTEMASCLIKSVLSKKMQYENDLQHLQVQEGDFSPSKEKVNQADMRALTTAPGVPPNSTKASQPSPVASTAGLRCGSDPQVYSNCSAQPTQPLAKEAPARVKDGADHSLCTATLEPQPWHPSSPQGLVPLLSTEHGNEGTVTGSLVFEQSSGRMLLDPTTGKYFYITVPTQPLCKTLFDPETGQYVTVQVPQQTAVYPGLYSTCTTSYPFFHYQSLYAPPFLPFSAGYFGGPIPVANQL
ncbi:serine/arginine repetitive matrix protein 2-like [Arapaima gigas]